MVSDRVAGTAQQAKGKAEAAAGRLTGDKKLWVEGRPDDVAGTFRNTAGDVIDAARPATDDPQSKVEHLRAEVERLFREPATPRLDAAANAADRYAEKLDRYLDAIRQRPLTSVSVAVGTGFLIGRLKSGNRYVNRIRR
ncbi:CsbD family protein [Belnapia sp. T18]|uniref:CsbD family protein n=1 Tax=Belnapia arida TaxID=2804533 RepID=A0ABS1UCX0_9PROT|nr:CsbD family protein [Belnapia arida]MBL6082000.1 CsbD family protein [Belnapia arida]